jgi:diaminopimelate epimerase
MELPFAKWHGLGNDFVVLDDGREVTHGQAIAICDRHFGVGADGVLMTGIAEDGRPYMKVINADGSTPEMCGNGLRCVALHLVRTGVVTRDSFDVDTDAGPHLVRIVGDAVEVKMAVPTLDPAKVPVRARAPMIDAPFEVDGETVHVTAVSMGNPHAVIFDEVGEPARFTLGPRIERDPRFPDRVNVGFAELDAARRRVDLAVFERGAGWTLACGTGACAAVVAAVETDRWKRGEPMEVRLPGGSMTIVVGAPGERVSMTGPATLVYEGRLDLAVLHTTSRPA